MPKIFSDAKTTPTAETRDGQETPCASDLRPNIRNSTGRDKPPGNDDLRPNITNTSRRVTPRDVSRPADTRKQQRQRLTLRVSSTQIRRLSLLAYRLEVNVNDLIKDVFDRLLEDYREHGVCHDRADYQDSKLLDSTTARTAENVLARQLRRLLPGNVSNALTADTELR